MVNWLKSTTLLPCGGGKTRHVIWCVSLITRSKAALSLCALHFWVCVYFHTCLLNVLCMCMCVYLLFKGCKKLCEKVQLSGVLQQVSSEPKLPQCRVLQAEPVQLEVRHHLHILLHQDWVWVPVSQLLRAQHTYTQTNKDVFQRRSIIYHLFINYLFRIYWKGKEMYSGKIHNTPW